MSVKVGVIGVGTMGEHHVRNYSAMEQVELVGIYDIDARKTQRVAKTFGTIAYTDLSKLLNKIEAASICVPTHLHKDVALEAMSEGVHVLVEKPISHSLEDADAIINEADRHNVHLMVGHVERFNPAIITLRDVIDKKKIIYIEAQRLGPYVEAHKEVGVILDLMIHDLDVVLSLVGSGLKQISSIVRKVLSGTEDIAHAQIIFENGIIAVFTASRITQRRVRKLNVTQKDSYVTADYQTQEVFIRSGLTAEYVGGQNVSYKQVGAVEIPYVQRGEPLRIELEHFVSCIVGDEAPDVTGQDGKKTLETALAVLAKSLTSGG